MKIVSLCFLFVFFFVLQAFSLIFRSSHLLLSEMLYRLNLYRVWTYLRQVLTVMFWQWEQSLRTSLRLKLVSSDLMKVREANKHIPNLLQWEKLGCPFRWRLSDYDTSQCFKYLTSWDFADSVVKNKSLISANWYPNGFIAIWIVICFPEVSPITIHLYTMIICYSKIGADQTLYQSLGKRLWKYSLRWLADLFINSCPGVLSFLSAWWIVMQIFCSKRLLGIRDNISLVTSEMSERWT